MPTLTLDHLYFERPGLNLEAHLTAHQGESIAILGVNGSGKTTFFDLIAGFLSPQRGVIAVHGEPITSWQPGMRPLSYLLQDSILFDHLNILKNLQLGVTKSRAHDASPLLLDEIIDVFSLNSLLTLLPSKLSGGQKQRVALARCLLAHQPILLLDEPFTGIDLKEKNTIIPFLKNHIERHSALLLFTSHHPDEIQALASRHIQIQVDKKHGHAYING
ncbi:MAG: ATP-binding cassette domain-containing protein [Candidatus Nucleicultricaceae bacterium]